MIRRFLARRKMRWAARIARRDHPLFTCGACARFIPPQFHERHHRWHERERVRQILGLNTGELVSAAPAIINNWKEMRDYD